MTNLLRAYVREALVRENASSATWYHGSPYCCMKSTADYDGSIMFVTDSLSVARDYTRSNPGLAAGRKPNQQHVLKPTIYTLALNFGEDQIFDLRKDEHLTLFKELMRLSKTEDPDDGFRKSDIVSVHAAPGSRISGEFPSFGIVGQLLPMLKANGYVAAFIAEGPQGASLAVSNPQKNVEILTSENI